MRIIDRYMIRGFLVPFIWCIFMFVVMAIIVDIFSFIDDIVKFHIAGSSLAAFYIYYTPSILVQVAPMAMLLSTIFVLSNLNKHSEIVAMKSSGMSLWRIITPMLIVGMIVSMLTFIVNDRIIPISSKVSASIRRDELEKGRSKERKDKVVNNVAIYGSGNKIFFARSYDTENKILSDVIIHEHDRNENLISKITAQSAEWTGKAWKFNKIIMYRIDNAGQILGEPLFYEERQISLKEKPADFANNEWTSDYMSYRELRKYIKHFQGTSPKVIRGLLVDMHYKIAFAFINFIIVLIGAPFALLNTRGGVMIGIGMAIVLGLLYYAFIAISLAFGKAGVIPPFFAAWLGNLVFLGLGVHLINKRT